MVKNTYKKHECQYSNIRVFIYYNGLMLKLYVFCLQFKLIMIK